MSKVITDLYEQVKQNVDFNNQSIPIWPDALDEPNNNLEHLGEGELISIDRWLRSKPIADRLMGNAQSVRSVSESDKELITGAVRHIGFEALAFYKSYRFIDKKPFRGSWGIFYIGTALDYVASQIHSYYPTWKNPDKLALSFLHKHEFHHFHADIQTLHLENLLKKPLYEPIRTALRGKSSHFVEESIANQKTYSFSEKKNIEDFAEDFMDIQPAAYCRYKEPELNLLAEWASITVDFSSPFTKTHRHDLAAWLTVIPKTYLRESICPQHVIATPISTWLPAVYKIPKINTVIESKAFSKSIKKLHTIKNTWDVTKHKLCDRCDSKGLYFKPWSNHKSKSIWAVRVGSNFRAHLLNLGDGVWEAIKIGDHKSMGHD